MNIEEEYLVNKSKWKEQINLHWSSFLESKILQMTFTQSPEVYDFFKKLTWSEASFEVLEESEVSTIYLEYPGYEHLVAIVMENYANDFTLYAHTKNQGTYIRSLVGVSNAESLIWKTFWEFDLFSYIYDFQKF